MDDINRNLVSKIFNYKQNDYNHRFGFEDEKNTNVRQLHSAIANQKTFLFKNNIKNGSKIYIESNNVCFFYFATLIAAAELGLIIDTKENSDYIIGRDIDIEELYEYKSRDSVLTHNLGMKRMRKDTKIYNNLSHFSAIKTARDLLHVYKGNVLIVSHPSIQFNLHKVILPLLINNEVKLISAVGVNDIQQAKEKINFMIRHLGSQQVFVYKEHLQHLDLPEHATAFEYS